MPNTYQIFREMFKLQKMQRMCVFFGVFNCSFKIFIKIDVLYLVSHFFRTRKKYFYILK